MKIEEIERLAAAVTAAIMGPTPVGSELRAIVRQWRCLYGEVLAEFIEQEKAELSG